MRECNIKSFERKGNKFNSKRIVTEDGKFDSKKEYERWTVLKLMEKEGMISNLKRQTPYVILHSTDKYRKVSYIADFVYLKDGIEVVEDVKGCKVGMAYNMFKLKKKMMYAFHGINIVEI